MEDSKVVRIDKALAELAQELAEGVTPVYDFEASKDEPWGGAEEGDKYHSEQVYSTNQGPSAGYILWEDLTGRADVEAETPDWADEYCDELAEAVSGILAERYPDRGASFAMWEDNCLFIIISEA